jgi:uncharacterized protein DUF1735
MKINKLLGKFGAFIAVTAALSGCLKDSDYDNGVIQSVRTTDNLVKPIELKISATNNTNFATVSVNSSPNDTTSDFLPVVLATADPAPEDLHVTVEMVDSLVDNYNNANGTDYTVPDASMYSISSMEVVIPKGSNTGYLQIKYHIPDYIGADWAFGFRIVSVKESGYTISGNFNEGVISLAVKNQYDGIYKGSGVMVHPVYSGTYANKDETLITSGANSVTLHYLNTTVTFGVDVYITIDPATNLLTLNTSAGIDPYDPAKNYYDPATRTFYLDFGYSGGTRHVTMVAVYNRPR